MDLKLADFRGTFSGDGENDPEVSVAWKRWLFEQRLEYARSFFDHHAKQRMSMFNYFLLFAGLIASGYAQLMQRSSGPLACALAMAGTLLTVIFIFLERRNEELVHIAEDVMRHLEEDVLFSGYDRNVRLPRRRNWLGVMQAGEKREWPLGIFRRQAHEERDEMLGRSLYEHGRWMPWFQALIAGLFLALAGFAAIQ